MICEQCKIAITEGDEVTFRGRIICEDCYVESIEPPRTCDVAAVYSAKQARKAAGQEGTDGLTDLQKDIYNYIKTEGPVTREQIMERFQLTGPHLERNFTVLRHCELARGFRENGKVLITIWQDGGPGEMNIGE